MDFEYIPIHTESFEHLALDSILLIISELNIRQLVSLFTSNKYLSSISNDPRILRTISEQHHLPYVTSFSNLVFYSKMNRLVLFDHAIGFKDERLIDYYDSIYDAENIIGDTIAYNLIDLFKMYVGEFDKDDIEYYISVIVEYNSYDVLMYLSHGDVTDIAIRGMEFAAMYGNMDMMKLFADNTEDKEIYTKCIRDASDSGYLEIVEFCVNKGGKLTRKSLNNAITYGHLDIVKYTLSKDRYLIDHDDKMTKKSMTLAIQSNNIELVEYLIEIGAKLPGNSNEIAVEYSDLDMIKFIGKYFKYDTNDISDAIRSDRGDDIIRYLISVYDGKDRDYIIGVCIQRGYTDILSGVLYDEYIVSVYDISESIRKKDYDMVKIFLDHGAIVTQRYIQIATRNKDTKMLDILKK